MHSLLVTCLAVGTTEAATTAYNIGSVGWSGSGGSYVVGFEFSISSSIAITHMGIADWFNDGISGTPGVGLWKADGTLLTTVTVPTGTAADLVEVQSNPSVTFYMEQLGTPMVLAPGHYVIANQHSQTSSQIFGFNGVTTWAPEITWVKGVAEANGGATLTFPNDISYGNMSYIGPQFKYDVVPEPTASVLLGLGALGFLVRRKR